MVIGCDKCSRKERNYEKQMMKKGIISIMLSLALMIGMMPALDLTAYAEGHTQ